MILLPRFADLDCIVIPFFITSRRPLFYFAIPLVHVRNSSSDQTLCRKRASRADEALPEFWRVSLRIRQERHECVEGVAHRVHNADDDRPLFSIRSADFVGPRHAQRTVWHRRTLEEERNSLQTRRDVPYSKAEGSKTT